MQRKQFLHDNLMISAEWSTKILKQFFSKNSKRCECFFLCKRNYYKKLKRPKISLIKIIISKNFFPDFSLMQQMKDRSLHLKKQSKPLNCFIHFFLNYNKKKWYKEFYNEFYNNVYALLIIFLQNNHFRFGNFFNNCITNCSSTGCLITYSTFAIIKIKTPQIIFSASKNYFILFYFYFYAKKTIFARQRKELMKWFKEWKKLKKL